MHIARVTRPQATATSAVPPNVQPASLETFEDWARRHFNKRVAATASNKNIAMDVAVRPATGEIPPQTDACIDATIYIKLKTTLEVIFVSGWGEFILQYQFNELDDRMSKLETGQNINKTAEETALVLNREMSMYAELIGKFITQQVTVTMAENINQYEKKKKNLRKAEEIEFWESHPQKTVRGAVDAPPRKTKHPRLKQTPSQDHLRNIRLDRHKAKRASFGALQGENPKNQAMLTAVRQETGKIKNSALQKRINVDQADLKNQWRKIVRSVQENVRERYGFLQDKHQPKKKNALIILTTMQKWLYFCGPTNLAFHNLKIIKVAPRELQ